MPKLRNSTRDTLTQWTEIEPLLPVFRLARHFHLTVIMDYSPIEVRAWAGPGAGWRPGGQPYLELDYN